MPTLTVVHTFTSFHGHHTFRGWVLTELLRLLTHSNTLKLWREERGIFYHHLCSREYAQSFLRTIFREVTWARRSQLIVQSRQRKRNEFLETYRACVLTLRKAQGWPALRKPPDLSLKELT